MAETVRDFFSELPNKVDPEKTVGMSAAFQFVITGDGGGEWYAKFADGEQDIGHGTVDSPNLTVTTSAETWEKIISGQLNGQAAFLTGKLKVKGDMSLAMKLPSLFKLG